MIIAVIKKFRAMAFVMALILSPGVNCAWASTLVVTSSGGGLYLLQGAGISSAAAMDIVISYDASALRNPRVEQGTLISGAMMAVNPNVPGMVRIAIIRLAPISGSGTIVSLTFDRIGSGSGNITGLTVKLTDINGTPLQAQTQVENPQETTASSSQRSTAQSMESRNAAVTSQPVMQVVAPVIAPGVIIQPPQDVTSLPEDKPVTNKEPVQKAQGPSVAKADDAARRGEERSVLSPVKEKAIYTQKSVLDLFRDYKGTRTPKALMALFDQEPLIGSRQEPPLVLSDGRTTAMVSFIAPADLTGLPDIGLIGASLVSLARDRENSNTWIAEVRPFEHVIEATMTVSLKDTAMVIPLTVSPKTNSALKSSGNVTEKDFDLYLKGSGRGRLPACDLNRDGKINYLDDYIFTANYLANLRKKGKIASTK